MLILASYQGMANRCYHGRYPRTFRTRETTRERQRPGAHHERRGDAEVPTEYQAVLKFCADEVAAGRSDAIDGIVNRPT